MTEDQFNALAEVMGMQPHSDSRECARLHFVEGMSPYQASKKVGTIKSAAYNSVKRCERAIALCHQVCGIEA